MAKINGAELPRTRRAESIVQGDGAVLVMAALAEMGMDTAEVDAKAFSELSRYVETKARFYVSLAASGEREALCERAAGFSEAIRSADCTMLTRYRLIKLHAKRIAVDFAIEGMKKI